VSTDGIHDFAWAVWFRQGFAPEGRWHLWESTVRPTRRDSLAARPDWIDGGEWRRMRRRGVVRCARITVRPSYRSDFP
jgi:hypothetical protein